MTKDQIKQKFIKEWETYIEETPSDRLVEIVLTTDLSDRQLSIEVDFEGTFVSIPLNSEWGFRVLKTIYTDGPEALEAACINYNPAKILSIKDSKGKRRIDYLEKEEIEELAQIFTLKYKIWEEVERVEPLTLQELLDDDSINEEIRALCIASNPELDLRNILTKVDSYESNVKNPVGKTISYDLYKGTILDTEVSYVYTQDASTDRTFMLAVKNEISKAKDAPASLVRVPKALHSHIEAIRRQGEKYTYAWDIDVDSKEWKEKWNSELTPLTGELYFDKLVYES